MTDNIISGLISGLLVTALVFFCRSFWIKTIRPLFEECVYKDAKIEGQWFSLYPTTIDYSQEVITIQRTGHAITGSITTTNGRDRGKDFKIHGSFRNLILAVIYESDDRKRTDRGTISLKLKHNGQKLEGHVSHYADRTDDIDTSEVIWFRDREALEGFTIKLKEKEAAQQRFRELEREQKLALNQIKKDIPQSELTIDPEDKDSEQGSGDNG